MSRSDLDRLRDTRAYATSALALRQWDDGKWSRSEVEYHALLFRIAILGKTVSQISETVLAFAPDVPSRSIVDTRNRIIHAYWRTDPTVIASIVSHRLEPLIAALDRLISLLELEAGR